MKNKRYPLILYREWMRPFPLPLFLIAAILAGFWVAARAGWLPASSPITVDARSPLVGAAAAFAAVLGLFVLVIPAMAYVRCRPDYLLLQLGLLRLIVSYSRVRTTRSVQHGQIHPPAAQPGSRRGLARRLAGRQCVAIELTSYPMAFFLLRALTHPFLFLGNQPGFLFAVDDWMTLDREVEEMHADLLARRHAAQRKPRLGALS
jgi:hypothetical protein